MVLTFFFKQASPLDAPNGDEFYRSVLKWIKDGDLTLCLTPGVQRTLFFEDLSAPEVVVKSPFLPLVGHLGAEMLVRANGNDIFRQLLLSFHSILTTQTPPDGVPVLHFDVIDNVPDSHKVIVTLDGSQAVVYVMHLVEEDGDLYYVISTSQED